MYLLSLIIVTILAVMFYRNNNFKLMLLMLAIDVYIIYSNQSGNTLTGFKNDMVKSIDESAGTFTDTHGIKLYDENKTIKQVK